MQLDEEAAAQAVHSVAARLGMADVTLAEGILAIINAKMADGIRTITVGRGIDPREYSLVAFGGAGPMHAVWLARELDIGEIIVPFAPGAFSAWGMQQADMRYDLVRNFFFPVAQTRTEDVAAVLRELVADGRAALELDGIPPEDMAFELSGDMRYVGQEYAVRVQIGQDVRLEDMEQTFHDAYLVRYGHSTPGAPVEFVNLRVAALGRIRRSPSTFQPPADTADPVMGQRQVIFDGAARATPIVQRSRLDRGWRSPGPIVIEEDTATTVVPPGYIARIDDFGNIVITKE